MNFGQRLCKLGEIAEVNPKISGIFEDNLPVSFLPMAGIDAETGTISSFESRSYGEVKKGYTAFLDGDLLIAKIVSVQ